MIAAVASHRGSILPSVAGPLLIVVAVVTVMHGFALGGRISNQHPDILGFWLPNYCFLGRTLMSGHIAAWDPYVMGGVPFAADPQSGWLYLPAMALFTALPCGAAMAAFIVFQPILGGLGLYAFLRSEGLRRPAATLAGLGLALPLASSRLGLFLPFPASLAWSAMTLAACSRYVRTTSWPIRLWWLLLTAASWGQLASAHAGHGLIVGTAALGFYLMATSARAVRHGRWSAREVASIIGLLVPALVLVNLALLLPRLGYLPSSSYGLGFGRLRAPGGREPTWPLKLAGTRGMYLGAVMLALALAAAWTRRHRAIALAFGLFGIVGYVASLNVVSEPLSRLLSHWPVLDFYGHYPGRFLLAVLLALPILAAIGFEAWLDAASTRERIAQLTPGLVVWIVLPLAFGVKQGFPLLAVLGVMAGGAALLLAGARPAAAIALPLVVAVELSVNGLVGETPHPTRGNAPAIGPTTTTGWFDPMLSPNIDPDAYLRAGPIAGVLEGQPGRYLSFAPDLLGSRGYLNHQDPSSWGLLANQRAILLRIHDCLGYNPFQTVRYWRFVRAFTRPPIEYNSAFFRTLPRQVQDLLDVRWIVARVNQPRPSGPIAVDGAWGLFTAPRPPSPASVVGSWRVEATADPAGEALR